MKKLARDLKTFSIDFSGFLKKRAFRLFRFVESKKSSFATLLYRQRGRFSRQFIHTGMAGITAFGMIISPVISDSLSGVVEAEKMPAGVVLSAEDESYMMTEISDKLRDKIMIYQVQEGDTVSSIAKKFDVSEDTIRWQNNLKAKAVIKVGATLEILPITGVSHKVQKGDTVYSLAKEYNTSAQAIVDFPFNTFTNDETFALAIGQTITVPDGIKKDVTVTQPTYYARLTPDAGSVTAMGSFVWPAQGSITQRYTWYHRGIDIANSAGPDILAADSGKVIIAGWPDNSGYGNRVVVDHGNGYVTLYAHLAKIYVVAGQTVARGSSLGKMGSTGRSTGTHLHFEIIKSGSKLNPLDVLK